MSYDYIIVGAGSSGAVLAARLSEDLGTRILLLEAGPNYSAADTPSEIRSPNPYRGLSPELLQRFQWPTLLARRSHAQEPQPYWRGRGVGGSSAINGQFAIRGMLEDYDQWAADGCAGWSGAEVLPDFIRLEDDLEFGDAPYHGSDGPIPIYRAPLDRWLPVDLALREAALDLGYGWSDDHNAPDSNGVSTYAFNSRDSRRISTNDGYLEPARGRENLTILGDVLVDRVCFEGMRATGVRVRIGDEWREISGREIILSAGAIHSPAILLRSGVGPGDELQSLGVPVIRDAPQAGRQMADHPGVGLFLHLHPSAQASDQDARHGNCIVRFSSGAADANDMMFASMNHSGTDEAGRTRGCFLLSAYQTFSLGSVRLTSVDPNEHPEVDMNMLSDERDLVRMRTGAHRLFALGRHPAAQAITEQITVDAQGRSMEDLASDNAIDEWLLATCVDLAHAVGTCRMGAPDDPHSVLDPQCRVIGLEGLRVVDASIMPHVPCANTHLTCVMIGEHMAGVLRGRQN